VCVGFALPMSFAGDMPVSILRFSLSQCSVRPKLPIRRIRESLCTVTGIEQELGQELGQESRTFI
jgi:hypothetical protein